MQKSICKEEEEGRQEGHQEDQVDLNLMQDQVNLYFQNNVREAAHARSRDRMLQILDEEENLKGQFGEFDVQCCLDPCPIFKPNDPEYEKYFYRCHICGIRYCGKHLQGIIINKN